MNKQNNEVISNGKNNGKTYAWTATAVQIRTDTVQRKIHL